MFCVEICRLERSRSGLLGWCCGCLFATLQAVAHPFAHARLLTQKRVRDQSAGLRRTMPDSGETAARPAISTTLTMDIMSDTIPPSIRGQKYISLTTFRKNGVAVATPVWFGEGGNKLYVMTRSDLGKTKRIRNNPSVRVAPSTIRGKVTGAEFLASARILPPAEHSQARRTINQKYWAARLPWIWHRTDTYIELTFT